MALTLEASAAILETAQWWTSRPSGLRPGLSELLILETAQWWTSRPSGLRPGLCQLLIQKNVPPAEC
ncbi:unnamed protein product [Boreogadus saida]